MRIYILLVLLFFSINQPSAQTVQLHNSRIPVTTARLSKENTLTLNLTVLIEGLFDGNNMIPDTITVELRDASSPTLIVDSQRGIINNQGQGTFNFTNAINGSSYYIVIKHRNAIETWSASTQTFISSGLSYDFTTAQSLAFGNNLKQVGTKWCIYSGDVNKDGYINLADLLLVNNDSYNIVRGYVETDLTGDLYTNLSDLSIVNNNSFAIISAKFPSGSSNVIYYAGKAYHVILIGTHYWLKENMNIGTMITRDLSQSDNGIIEKYCFDDDSTNCDTYGGLYTWDEAMGYTTNSGARGICPSGWHIPTLTELSTLNTAVNGDGNALKEIGQGTGAGEGTNTSGFSALIDGYFYSGFFFDHDPRISTDFWSSSENHISTTNYIYLFSYNNDITLTINDKSFGYNLRCVMN